MKKLHHMRTPSWHSSLTSKLSHHIDRTRWLTDYRNHDAVRSKAQQIFHAICLALEAETLQGQTAQKVANSAKVLATNAGVDATSILNSLSPDGQTTVKSFFT